MTSKPHPARNDQPPPPADPSLALTPLERRDPARLERGMLIVTPDTPLADCPTSLDLATEEGRCQLLNALNAPDLYLDDRGEVLIAAVHYVVHPAARADAETGEIHEYSRLVLIDHEGRRYATASPVVAHRLAQAIRLWPKLPWDPPLSCRIRARLNRARTRSYHELEVYPRAGL